MRLERGVLIVGGTSLAVGVGLAVGDIVSGRSVWNGYAPYLLGAGICIAFFPLVLLICAQIWESLSGLRKDDED